MALVGKYVFVNDEDYYNTGVIKEVIDDCCLLITLNAVHGPNTTRLFHLSELANQTGSIFFDTKEEMDIWVKWLEEPDPNAPKVVTINGRKTKSAPKE